MMPKAKKPKSPPLRHGATEAITDDMLTWDQEALAAEYSRYEIDISALRPTEKGRIQRMDRLVLGYRITGSIIGACRVCNERPDTIYWYHQDNIHRFRDRIAAANAIWGDRLEDTLYSKIQQQGPQGNILLLAALNANLPQKYRPNATVADDAARGVLVRLREAGRRSAREAVTGGDGAEMTVGIERFRELGTGDVVDGEVVSAG